MSIPPTVHHGVVANVPAFWVQTGRPTLSASLLFRSGWADEDFRTHGISHLIEHLALGQVARPGVLSVNGSVDAYTSRLQFHGPVEVVHRELRRVMQFFNQPDLSRMRHEADILRAESTKRAGSLASDAMLWRFGYRGLGLAGQWEAFLDHLDMKQLKRWLAARYTNGNAVLIFDGPPPPLEIGLPEGIRFPGRQLIDLHQAPCSYQSPGIVVSGLVRRSRVAGMIAPVIAWRLTDALRNQRGRTYSPGCEYLVANRTQAVITAGADLPRGIDRKFAEGFLNQLEQLATDGVPADELKELIAARCQAMLDPMAANSWAFNAGLDYLDGIALRPSGQLLAEIAGLTPQDTCLPLTQLWESLYFGFCHPGVSPDRLRRLQHPPAPRHVIRSFPSLYADSACFVVADSGCGILSDASSAGVSWDKILMVRESEDGALWLLDEDGWQLTLEPTLYRNGRELRDIVQAKLPATVLRQRLSRPASQVPQPPGWWQRISIVLRDVAARTTVRQARHAKSSEPR